RSRGARALHSFPTRRSSDLGRLRQIFSGLRADYADPAALVGQRVIVVANLKPRQMKFGLSEGMIVAAGGPEGSGRPHRIATFAEDRKSTRLNSSHVAISYAV